MMKNDTGVAYLCVAYLWCSSITKYPDFLKANVSSTDDDTKMQFSRELLTSPPRLKQQQNK